MAPSVEAIRKEVEAQSKFVARLRDRMARVIVGQQYLVDRLLVGLLANGHVLIEGVPGLAKTTAVKTLAQAMNCSFSRIQFTPDLLPADLIGTLVYSPKDGEFTTKKGPIRQHHSGGRNQPGAGEGAERAPRSHAGAPGDHRRRPIRSRSRSWSWPQNPIEQEGTYPLPEAQVDRFMLKLRVNYPSKIEEREIMDRVNLLHAPEVRPAVTREEILQAQALVNQIYVDEKAKDYIVNIVQATRHPEAFELNINHLIEYGASPRATIYLQQAARALAFLQGEGNVFPNDVKQVAMDILRHRIIVTYEAEAENMTSEDIIRQILDTVPVP